MTHAALESQRDLRINAHDINARSVAILAPVAGTTLSDARRSHLDTPAPRELIDEPSHHFTHPSLTRRQTQPRPGHPPLSCRSLPPPRPNHESCATGTELSSVAFPAPASTNNQRTHLHSDNCPASPQRVSLTAYANEFETDAAFTPYPRGFTVILLHSRPPDPLNSARRHAASAFISERPSGFPSRK